MESIRTCLFEDPFYLYVAMGIAELVLLFVWRAKRTSKTALLLLVPPVLAIGFWGLERLVETDRETITRLTYSLAEEIEAENTSLLRELVDEEYTGYGKPRDELVYLAEYALKQNPLESVSLTDCNVQVDGDQAVMSVNSLLVFEDSSNDTPEKYPLKWKTKWIKRGDDWKILHVEKPRFNDMTKQGKEIPGLP